VKRWLARAFWLSISVAILAWLVWDVSSNANFATLLKQPKDWGALLLASLLLTAMVCTTFVRWYFLVRALDMPFSLKDAFRLGFLGYLFNFISLGAVGGDLFKAIFIAKEQRGRRPEAVATVLIDRLIGLWALFILATIAILFTDLLHSDLRQVRVICKATLIGTGIGGLGMLLVLTPGFTNGALSEMLTRLPRVGAIIGKLIGAVRIYRRKLPVLFWTTVMSLGVHLLGATGIYFTARGLGGNAPSLGYHFVVVPLGMIVGILPLPMSGLGAFEAVIEFFYRNVPNAVVVQEGQGLIVAFGYRVITILIAAVGLVYWLGSRREVAEVLHETEQLADEAPLSLPATIAEPDILPGAESSPAS
jgi:glycosyltransferase 2 family protein